MARKTDPDFSRISSVLPPGEVACGAFGIETQIGLLSRGLAGARAKRVI
jgi:hypothetical protein